MNGWRSDARTLTQAPSSEKDVIVCGADLGLEFFGKVALITRALYDGKVSRRDFWHHLRDCMDHLGFTACQAEPDVWMRAATNPDGEEYFEYVLLYVDNCLVISHKPEAILREEIGKHFKLKEDLIGPPSQYLGGKLRQVTIANIQKCSAFGSTQYVRAVVDNVEEYL